MKLNKRYLPLLLCVLAFASKAVAVDPLETSRVELGISHSFIKYKEPSVMVEEGNLLALTGKYTVFSGSSVSAVDITYSKGRMDYNGSGLMKDIPDYIFEIRGILGERTMYGSFSLTTYAGLGYRYLNDDSHNMRTSTNYVGYLREQTYIYAPIGVEIGKNINESSYKWQVSVGLEYDYFLKGTNTSHIGYISGAGDSKFTQKEGYGARLHASFKKKLNELGESLVIQPFYKYWNVSESDVYYDNNGQGWIEPDNSSKEWGVAVLISF